MDVVLAAATLLLFAAALCFLLGRSEELDKKP